MSKYPERHRKLAANTSLWKWMPYVPRISRQKGMVLIIAMAFVMLMTLSMVSFTSVLKQDMELIQRVKEAEQARNIAEAGINHAMAVVRYSVETADDLTQINGTLDTGTYTVTFESPVEVEGEGEMKYQAVSTGSVNGSDISQTMCAEIRLPIVSHGYGMEAGGNVKIYAPLGWLFRDEPVMIKGNIHANQRVILLATAPAAVWDDAKYRTIVNDPDDGNTAVVSGRIRVREGILYIFPDLFDTGLYINGINNDMAAVLEGNTDAPMVQLPTVDWGHYKTVATSGSPADYYDSDTVFTNVTLTPTNGVVYVKGDAVFNGDCTLNGGIVSTDNIVISPGAVLEQNKTDHNRNVIISKNGDIRIGGTLRNVTLEDIVAGSTGDEAVMVYSGVNIRFICDGAQIAIKGAMVAKGNIELEAFYSSIGYLYEYVHPEDVRLYPTTVGE